jgi:hypothetical protein
LESLNLKNISIILNHKWCIIRKLFVFNYKHNLLSRNTLCIFPSSITYFEYNHLIEPKVEGQKVTSQGTISLPILYFVPLRGAYIQMSLFLETSKWESQNLDSYYPKILAVHIFFKSNCFWKYKGNVLYPSKTKFQWCITHSNETSFDPCFLGIYGQESNSQFDYYPFFWS